MLFYWCPNGVPARELTMQWRSGVLGPYKWLSSRGLGGGVRLALFQCARNLLFACTTPKLLSFLVGIHSSLLLSLFFLPTTYVLVGFWGRVSCLVHGGRQWSKVVETSGECRGTFRELWWPSLQVISFCSNYKVALNV
jgi:hypothetical protein